MRKSVYISSPPEEAALFSRRVEGCGFRVHAAIPYRYETIETGYLPFTDWIFFKNPQAVIHFFGQDLLAPATAMIGAADSRTATALMEIGIQPSFVGTDGEPSATREGFSAAVKNRDVLFPCGDKECIAPFEKPGFSAPIIKLPIYQFVPEHITGLQAEIFVFTSPIAVEAFIGSNGLPEGTLLAIDHYTFEALHQLGLQAACAPSANLEALADLVCALA
ncbi:MAG: uroporphyrinogen-III synthase [Bacteroidia bacterium]|nr:uroporphyrinogen-III synthase [Bacteroidia bacterium]MCC6767439.1 uroporphyrinogen-III synthase [Bacteroidia bacterium]